MTPLLLALTTFVAGDARAGQGAAREPVAAARASTFSFPGRWEVVIHADALKYRFDADRRTRTVRIRERGSDRDLAEFTISPDGSFRGAGLSGGTFMGRRGPRGSMHSLWYLARPGELIGVDFIRNDLKR
jgi:hypothetical protein